MLSRLSSAPLRVGAVALGPLPLHSAPLASQSAGRARAARSFFRVEIAVFRLPIDAVPESVCSSLQCSASLTLLNLLTRQLAAIKGVRTALINSCSLFEHSSPDKLLAPRDKQNTSLPSGMHLIRLRFVCWPPRHCCH